MKLSRAFSGFWCALLTVLLLVPSPLPAQGQRAGEVQRVVPDASIERAAQRLAAAAKSPVHWQDVVLTAAQGRARVRLDDGSTLNVGSASSLRIETHDAAAQRTGLELGYGRIRSQVVRLARPGAQYEVRTPVATAGVIGTDFFLAFENSVALLIVFEGLVRLCDLAGNCVDVGPGMSATVRADQAPAAPAPVTPAASRDAVESTQVEEPAAPAGMSGRKLALLAAAATAGLVALGWALGRRGGHQERLVDQTGAGLP